MWETQGSRWQCYRQHKINQCCGVCVMYPFTLFTLFTFLLFFSSQLMAVDWHVLAACHLFQLLPSSCTWSCLAVILYTFCSFSNTDSQLYYPPTFIIFCMHCTKGLNVQLLLMLNLKKQKNVVPSSYILSLPVFTCQSSPGIFLCFLMRCHTIITISIFMNIIHLRWLQLDTFKYVTQWLAHPHGKMKHISSTEVPIASYGDCVSTLQNFLAMAEMQGLFDNEADKEGCEGCWLSDGCRSVVRTMVAQARDGECTFWPF